MMLGGDLERRTGAKSFRDLVVWQRAHAFVLAVYRLTGTFPKQETYGAISQTRRVAVSIASNIAEGFKRKSRLEKAHFLNIAQGSLEESSYYLILAHDLQWADTLKARTQLDELSRLLESYRQAIQHSAT